jgi:hypothetical protein
MRLPQHGNPEIDAEADDRQKNQIEENVEGLHVVSRCAFYMKSLQTARRRSLGGDSLGLGGFDI